MTTQHINSNSVKYEYQRPLLPEVYAELELLAELAAILNYPELDLQPYGKLGAGVEAYERLFMTARIARGTRLRVIGDLQGRIIRANLEGKASSLSKNLES